MALLPGCRDAPWRSLTECFSPDRDPSGLLFIVNLLIMKAMPIRFSYLYEIVSQIVVCEFGQVHALDTSPSISGQLVTFHSGNCLWLRLDVPFLERERKPASVRIRLPVDAKLELMDPKRAPPGVALFRNSSIGTRRHLPYAFEGYWMDEAYSGFTLRPVNTVIDPPRDAWKRRQQMLDHAVGVPPFL